MDHHSKSEIMFTQLILMFHTAAMQQLGKLKNPVTDTTERNLEAAQNSIDILDMLKERTAGNVSEEEGRLLSQVIRELKLNYVDEAKKPSAPSDQKA
jgi:hypothetical protein